jgi:hypothetical protein
MHACAAQAKAVAGAGVRRAAEFNRRTLDGLAARLHFYLSLAHERTGTLAQIRRCPHSPSLLTLYYCMIQSPNGRFCESSAVWVVWL